MADFSSKSQPGGPKAVGQTEPLAGDQVQTRTLFSLPGGGTQLAAEATCILSTKRATCFLLYIKLILDTAFKRHHPWRGNVYMLSRGSKTSNQAPNVNLCVNNSKNDSTPHTTLSPRLTSFPQSKSSSQRASGSGGMWDCGCSDTAKLRAPAPPLCPPGNDML